MNVSRITDATENQQHNLPQVLATLSHFSSLVCVAGLCSFFSHFCKNYKDKISSEGAAMKTFSALLYSSVSIGQ